MYEDRPGYPGHNVELAGGGYFPKGSNNSYQEAWWVLKRSRGGYPAIPLPHVTMLQETGKRGGSGSRDVSLLNFLKRWETMVYVVPAGTEYREGLGFLTRGVEAVLTRVCVGELPGETERILALAEKAEPRYLR